MTGIQLRERANLELVKFNALVLALQTNSELSATYVRTIGYDPFQDDPTITHEDVISILSEQPDLKFK